MWRSEDNIQELGIFFHRVKVLRIELRSCVLAALPTDPSVWPLIIVTQFLCQKYINHCECVWSEEMIAAGGNRCALPNSGIKKCIHTSDIAWYLINICRFYIFMYQF